MAVSSLALGIGANCAAFSWADALLLRPLTVARPSEVVTVGSTMSVEGFSRLGASYREYIDIRDRSTSFDGLVAFTGVTSGLAATPEALPKLTLGMMVSGNFFTVMGVEPELGRNFRPEEDEVPGRDAVVILSHSLWQQHFGADPSDSRPARAAQRDRVHRRRRRARDIHRDESVRPIRLLRSADDVAAAAAIRKRVRWRIAASAASPSRGASSRA